MNPYALISLAAFMVCFFLGNFIYHKNPKNQLNIMIALLSIFVGLMAFVEFEYRQAIDFSTAYFWLKVSVLWPVVPPIVLHIALIFTEKTHLLKNKLTYLVIYGPAFIMAILALYTNWLLIGIVKEYWGWTYLYPINTLLFDAMTVWTVVCSLLAAGLCFAYYIRAKNLKRLQAKYVMVGIYLPLIISLVSDLVLPSTTIRVPEMSMAMSTIGISFISYGIWKYRFPALTTAAVADDIVSTMSNFLILLDHQNKIITVNQATLDLLGYSEKELITTPVRILFSDINQYDTFNDALLRNNSANNIETYLKSKSGEIIPVLLSKSIIRSDDSRIIGIVCIGNDIADIKKAETKIKSSLQEKELLLREIHHRVKNNLQIISSLLNLQSEYVKDQKDLELWQENITRVKSMAIIHDELYHTPSVANINLRDYLTSFLNYIYFHYDASKIKMNIDVEDIKLNVDTAIPCGLILNELVTNSIKHAFPGKTKGEIHTKVRSENNNIILTVKDNGIGLPDDIDFRNTETLGLKLVVSLTYQLNGKIELNKEDGTEFTIIFQELKYKKRV